MDPAGRPLGLRLLLPGSLQWSWDQRERSFLLSGGYLSACLMSLAGWGSSFGLFMIVGAYALHVLSIHDALRQALFPGLGRTAPTLLSAAAVGVGFYVPTILLASSLAWPGRSREDGRGYLIDRLAYRNGEPRRGDRVWIGDDADGGSSVSEVVAVGGEEIHWSDDRLFVGGLLSGFRPFIPEESPRRLAFSVPEGHLLVACSGTFEGRDRWRIVSRDVVRGRAWATTRPLWNRGRLD